MKLEIPYTLGFEVNKALTLLDGFQVKVDETSTVFQDKKEERKDKTPIVVRQINKEDCIYLTIARFK